MKGMRKRNIELSLIVILLLSFIFVPRLRKTILIILSIAILCYLLVKVVLLIKHKKEIVHDINSAPQPLIKEQTKTNYILKESLITKCEKPYFETIKKIIEPQYIIQPQINLASIVDKKSNDKFRNELFRNIDFGIFDQNYKPLVLIEVNDDSHVTRERKERDQKVKTICTNAGIPIITLWTKFGVNEAYIKKRLSENLSLIDNDFSAELNQKEEYQNNFKINCEGE